MFQVSMLCMQSLENRPRPLHMQPYVEFVGRLIGSTFTVFGFFFAELLVYCVRTIVKIDRIHVHT